MTDSQATVDESFMVLGGRVIVLFFKVCHIEVLTFQFCDITKSDPEMTSPNSGLEWKQCNSCWSSSSGRIRHSPLGEEQRNRKVHAEKELK